MNFRKTGYNLGVIAAIIILLWIGLFKFTPTEAMGIKHYVGTSFLMSWMYKVASVHAVSNIIGTYEVVTGLLLLASFWNRKAGLLAGYLGAIIFLTTLSFLITAPGTWKLVDGFPTTDFFVLKDLGYLAIFLLVIGHHTTNEKAVRLTN
ncbi:DUF417 family protein [Mucilaginibacter sp.]|uniref:DUF417 family protein n=1 Tax=Mucilaginibacter sp. TaxID=1882438 RepID=UPI003B00246E